MVRITNYRRDFSEDEFQFDDWADDIVEDYESSVRENEKITKKMSQESLKSSLWLANESERSDWSNDFIRSLDFKREKVNDKKWWSRFWRAS